jgi:hypothetical protein
MGCGMSGQLNFFQASSINFIGSPSLLSKKNNKNFYWKQLQVTLLCLHFKVISEAQVGT